MNVVTLREFSHTNPQDDPEKYPRLPPGYHWDAYERIYRDPRFDSPDRSIPIVAIGEHGVNVRRDSFFLLRFGQSAIRHSEFIVSRGLRKIGMIDEPHPDTDMLPGGTRHLYWLIYVKPSKDRREHEFATIVELVRTPNGDFDQRNLLVLELLPQTHGLGGDAGAMQRVRYPTISYLSTGFINGTRDSIVLKRRGNHFLIVDNMAQTEQMWRNDAEANKLWDAADEYVRDGSFHIKSSADDPPGGDRGITRIFYDDEKYAAAPADVPILAAAFHQMK